MFKTSETYASLKGKSGVYRITLCGSNRHYIGATSELYFRMRAHLNAKKKFCIHEAIAQYGSEAFEFVVLALCGPGELGALEAHYIKEFNSVAHGYNVCPDKYTFCELARKTCHTPESRAASSKRLLGKKLPESWRTAMRRSQAKWRRPIHQFDREGNFVKSYPSAKEASKETGLHATNLTGACNHPEIHKTCGGYIWKYAEPASN